MSLFEDFIQRELPLRPFTPTNPPEESVPVRRGLGPRQLEFVELTDGQVLGKEGGVIKGVNVGTGSGFAKGYEYTQIVPLLQWNILHYQGSERVQITIWDDTNHQIYPDDVEIDDDNYVKVRFTAPQTGRAILIFF